MLGNVLKLNFAKLTWVDYVVIINQLIYMTALVMMIISFIRNLLSKERIKETIFLLAILTFGTGLSVITVGGARYHFPYLPIFFMMSAVLIKSMVIKRISRKNPQGPESIPPA